MINYSIIIPHKNIPILLQRCIDSIPQRDDLEIIIVDDNSNSNIVNFNQFPGLTRKNTHIIFTKEGKGAGYARNIGMKYAKGIWILFADADDFFLNNLTNVLDSYKDTNSNIILFKTQCRISNNINIVGKRHFLCNSWNKLIDNYNEKVYNPQILLSKVVVPWGKMIRKDFLLKYNIYFEEIMYANDVMWSTYLSINISPDDFIASPHTIYCLTENDNSLYNNQNHNAFLTRFKVLHRQRNVLNNYNIDNNESINYPYYFNQAQKKGILVLIKAIYIAIKNNKQIDSIYDIEKQMKFKYPYLYFLIVILQAIYHKFKF